MSQPKRVEYYQVGYDGMVRNHDIDYTRGIGSLYVCAADYAALAAENERLRKAGDAMHAAAVQDSTGLWLTKPFEDWAKAKEGGSK